MGEFKLVIPGIKFDNLCPMKRILLISLFCLGSLMTVSAQLPKKATVEIKTKIYCDHCLKCADCSGNINMALRKYPGVKKTEIKPGENKIVVVYNPKKTSPERLRKLISDAGFDADDVKANPDSVAKLDTCCRPK